jgi:hypothetical protein
MGREDCKGETVKRDIFGGNMVTNQSQLIEFRDQVVNACA